jgi:hypothetical protein
MKLREAITKAGNEADLVVIQVWADTFLASLEAFGYCIVPTKATTDMECAVTDPDDCATPDAAACVWRDMIAARPTIED